MDLLKFGDLVEIDYPFVTQETMDSYNNGYVSQKYLRESIHTEKRFGIILSEPFDRTNSDGSKLEKCLYSVYDVEQMYVYNSIYSGYLILQCSL